MAEFFEIQPSEYYEYIYRNIQLPVDKPILIHDHIGGFKSDYSNDFFDFLSEIEFSQTVITEYIFHNSEVLKKYKHLDLKFLANVKDKADIGALVNYKIHPNITYKNFLCSFSGSQQEGKLLLTALLHKFGLFDKNYCSKNFVCNYDNITGHIDNLINKKNDFYYKFFTDDNDFLNNINSFNYDRFDHIKNINTLRNKITESFLHLVAETFSVSYYPFVTEKFCTYRMHRMVGIRMLKNIMGLRNMTRYLIILLIQLRIH